MYSFELWWVWWGLCWFFWHNFGMRYASDATNVCQQAFWIAVAILFEEFWFSSKLPKAWWSVRSSVAYFRRGNLAVFCCSVGKVTLLPLEFGCFVVNYSAASKAVLLHFTFSMAMRMSGWCRCGTNAQVTVLCYCCGDIVILLCSRNYTLKYYFAWCCLFAAANSSFQAEWPEILFVKSVCLSVYAYIDCKCWEVFLFSCIC